MSPVGTMASDSTVHGVHNQHRHPVSGEEDQALYDTNSYPFNNDISLSTSRDEPPEETAYYQSIGGGEEDDITLHPHDSGSQRAGVGAGARGGYANWERNGLGVESGNNGDISPRGSTIVGPYETGSGYQYSPQHRGSAFRSSLVMPGSPRQPIPQQVQAHELPERLDFPPSPHRGSQIRSSLPNIGTPPRRVVIDQHRGSAPVNGSPIIGSPQFREAPRGSPQPQDGFRGYRRYDEFERPNERDHLSPVPPYQSPRNSYAQRPPPRDDDKHDRRYAERYDSQTTLRGEYDEKKGYDAPRDAPYRRGRAMSDTSQREPMQRRTTREVENDDDASSYHVKGGVLSQLLKLTGKGSTLRRRISSRGASSAGPGDLPTMQSLGLKRASSTASTVWGADELDPDDPRVTGQKKKNHRRGSFGDLPFTRTASMDGGRGKGRRASIQYHVAG
jgi:hypothetical protein